MFTIYFDSYRQGVSKNEGKYKKDAGALKRLMHFLLDWSIWIVIYYYKETFSDNIFIIVFNSINFHVVLWEFSSQ